MDQLIVPISAGELFDKISILMIKAERISDPPKLAHVRAELELLQAIASEHFPSASPELEGLLAQLKSVNEAIWEAENIVRECDRLRRFDDIFVSTARSTYQNNDRRAALKREINVLLESPIVEVKSHANDV
jgi:hypothetical protein